jgi:hypothetical protein
MCCLVFQCVPEQQQHNHLHHQQQFSDTKTSPQNNHCKVTFKQHHCLFDTTLTPALTTLAALQTVHKQTNKQQTQRRGSPLKSAFAETLELSVAQLRTRGV